MRFLVQIWLTSLLALPLVAHADLPEFTASSNFRDHLRTSPTTGEPILFRNGTWVSVDQRLKDLLKTTREVLELSDKAEFAETHVAATNEALTKINGLGIPPGVFLGDKFDRTIKDPKLAKIMEMEWYLGLANAIKFKGINMQVWRRTVLSSISSISKKTKSYRRS